MNCPACDGPLEEPTISDVLLDVCSTGCGGVWFDQFEFRKFDEPREEVGAALLDLEGIQTRPTGADDRFACPRCDEDVVLRRRFLSTKRQEWGAY